jgi:phage-related protein (TIGR01555 family)
MPRATRKVPKVSEAQRRKILGIPERVVREDDWSSVMTGLGRLGVDKTLGGGWTYQQVDQLSAQNMWRGDDTLDRVVRIVPRDMLRQGFEIAIQDEKEMAEQVDQKLTDMLTGSQTGPILQTCLEWERAYGGCGLFLGANDGAKDLSLPLQEDRIKTFDYVTPFTPLELVPVTYYSNPLKARYGEVATWRLTPLERPPGYAPDLATLPVIHESRIIRFVGNVTSRGQILYNIHPGWGDSIFTLIRNIFQVFNGAFQGLGILVEDFAPIVIKIKGLAQAVAGQDGSVTSLQRRAGGISAARSIARATIIDSEEEYGRQSTDVAGLADLWDRIVLRAAAAAGMPLSLFLGQSPAGLAGAGSGQTDISWYYDALRAAQVGKLKRPIDRLYELTIKAKEGPTKGKVPDNWSVHFRPLVQLSEKDLALLHFQQAQADQIYIDEQVTTPEEIRSSRFEGDEYSLETRVNTELAEDAIAEVGEGDVAAMRLGVRPEDIHPPAPSITDIDKTQNLNDPAIAGNEKNPPMIPSKAAAAVAKSVTAKTPQPQPIDKQVARQVAKSVSQPKKSVKA